LICQDALLEHAALLPLLIVCLCPVCHPQRLPCLINGGICAPRQHCEKLRFLKSNSHLMQCKRVPLIQFHLLVGWDMLRNELARGDAQSQDREPSLHPSRHLASRLSVSKRLLQWWNSRLQLVFQSRCT